MQYSEESQILKGAQADQKVVLSEDQGFKTSVAIITGAKGQRKVREDAQYVAHNGSKNPSLN